MADTPAPSWGNGDNTRRIDPMQKKNSSTVPVETAEMVVELLSDNEISRKTANEILKAQLSSDQVTLVLRIIRHEREFNKEKLEREKEIFQR